MTQTPERNVARLAERLRAGGCVFAEAEAELLADAAQTAADLERFADRRAAGEPLEHVVGWARFCGRRVTVRPGVFVPRPRTEFLVRQALLLLSRRSHDVAVELCCGSGAVAAAVASVVPLNELYAVDIDEVAVACARENLAALGAQTLVGDLYEPLPPRLRGRVDVLLANPPYVPTDAIAFLPLEARLHEPRIALDGGPGGLAVQRRILEAAPLWLRTGGAVVVETSVRQAPKTADIARNAGLLPEIVGDDDATVIVASSRP